MQSLELVKSSELIMVFRISKIHTNADFTFSNNKSLKFNDLGLDIIGRYMYILLSSLVKLGFF